MPTVPGLQEEWCMSETVTPSADAIKIKGALLSQNKTNQEIKHSVSQYMLRNIF
jgi:hypothetical protein